MVGERDSRWAAAGVVAAARASSTRPSAAQRDERDTATSRGRWASAARGGGVLCLDLPARRAARKSVLTPRSAAHAFAATVGVLGLLGTVSGWKDKGPGHSSGAFVRPCYRAVAFAISTSRPCRRPEAPPGPACLPSSPPPRTRW